MTITTNTLTLHKIRDYKNINLCGKQVEINYRKKHFRSSKVEINVSDPNIKFIGKTKRVLTIQKKSDIEESDIEDILLLKGNISIYDSTHQIIKKDPVSLKHLIEQESENPSRRNADQNGDAIKTNQSNVLANTPYNGENKSFLASPKPNVDQPISNQQSTQHSPNENVDKHTTDTHSGNSQNSSNGDLAGTNKETSLDKDLVRRLNRTDPATLNDQKSKQKSSVRDLNNVNFDNIPSESSRSLTDEASKNEGDSDTLSLLS